MRFKAAFILAIGLLLVGTSGAFAQNTEDEIVERYMKKLEKKRTTKLAWVSGYFSVNRVNRNNGYNDFAVYESNNFPTATIPWIDQAVSFGADFGVVFKERFVWTLGGEYWMKMGDELSGSYVYTPVATAISDPKSELKVYGITTGLQYYILNPPSKDGVMKSLALRSMMTVGFYHADWDIWQEYNNLNLATSTSTGDNTTFTGTAPGISFGMGADYPIRLFDLVLGVDMSYLYLNFSNVAWYNAQDEEVIVSTTGTADGRVDLELSGFTGKIQIKRFLSW
ncbi:MAG: hypothetical protein KAU36_04090 [candidate division Zixibacteria bacterium]|nr:hypothetical protein [candidate division Zixibacteria bacterium]